MRSPAQSSAQLVDGVADAGDGVRRACTGCPSGPRRTGWPEPMAIVMRSGRRSSSAEPVIARTSGWRVNGLTDPSATRKESLASSESAVAMAVP